MEVFLKLSVYNSVVKDVCVVLYSISMEFFGSISQLDFISFKKCKLLTKLSIKSECIVTKEIS